MKNIYYSLPLQYGNHTAGILKILVAPKEWLTENIQEDFSTGVLVGPANFNGKQFLELQFTQKSYEYNSDLKKNKQGDFYEITVSGIINNIFPNVIQTLETLKNHELIVAFKDRQQRNRLFGNTDAGAFLTYKEKNINKDAGEQTIEITLTYQSKEAPKFYIDNNLSPQDLNSIYNYITISNDMAPVIPIPAGILQFIPATLTIIEKIVFPTNLSFDFSVGTSIGYDDIIDTTSINPLNKIITHDIYLNPGTTIYFNGVPNNQSFFLLTRKLQ